jgi:Ca-activated chloride channel homolog
MSDLMFAHGELSILVWIVLALVAGLIVFDLLARDRLASFLSPVMQSRLTARAGHGRFAVKMTLFALFMLCGVLAMMRPQLRGKQDVITSGRASADVMFVLDVSRSMLAEDAPPNRLARAKQEIGQLVSRLDGHRVGLIAFAGRTAQVCPLTPDHAFFNTVLGTVDTRSAGKGGTRVGEAIKAALNAFPPGVGAKLIVLITDGDDQDQYTQDAAKAARDAGVKIVAVGLGSEDGSQITLTDPQTGAKTTLMYDGKPVISKLDRKALEQVALTTEGAYIPAGTNAVDLDAIMASHVQPILKSAVEAAQKEVPAELYVWPLLVSFAFLLAALWVGSGDNR